MCRLQFDVTRVRDHGGEHASLRGSRGGIVRAGDYRHRHSHAGRLHDEIGIANRFAAGDVPLRRRIENHLADGSNRFRGSRDEVPGEPAHDGGGNNRAHSAGANGGNARVPGIGGPNVRGGIAEHQPFEALGRVRAQPDSRLAAHGNSAKISAGDSGRVEHGKNVAAEVLLRESAGGHRGEAVAASVVTQDAIFIPEGGDLRIPHGQIGAQRIGKGNHRRARLPFQPVAQAYSVTFDERHRRNPRLSWR